jgi:hypothetical protein
MHCSNADGTMPDVGLLVVLLVGDTTFFAFSAADANKRVFAARILTIWTKSVTETDIEQPVEGSLFPPRFTNPNISTVKCDETAEQISTNDRAANELEEATISTQFASETSR